MKGFLVGLTKLILGISLALVLLSLAGVATARYFMARLSYLPPRPAFDNDVANVEEAVITETVSPEPAAVPAPVNAAPDPVSESAPSPGSYEAVVIQPIGLVLRAGPGIDYERLGGVDYNDQILVLKTSDDGRWLNVRTSDTGQEGWIKAGNTQNLTE